MIEIWDWIAHDSVQNADRVIDKLEEEIRGLAEMPGKGHGRSDVRNQNYRFWSVYSYVIGYHFDDKTLFIDRVIHGHRNFRRLFK
jgi:toxin ParE1/3/4